MKSKNISKKRGAVSIILVMGLGILILLIVISVTSVETARLYLAQANVDGAQAYEYAQSGVRDALSLISRDNNLGTTTIKYKIDMADNGCNTMKACSMIVISPLQVSSYPVTGRIIGSIGYYKSAIKGLETKIFFDQDDLGEIIISENKETLTPFGI